MNNVIKLIANKPQIVVDDLWHLVDSEAEHTTKTKLILPLIKWLDYQRDYNHNKTSQHAVWLNNDDDVTLLSGYLSELPMIALDFPKFSDGRAYSQANLLRNRMRWSGELRAIGDVFRDQLTHMKLCGFDAYVIRADKNVKEALKGLSGISVLYANSVVEPLPLFRRRDVEFKSKINHDWQQRS